MGKTHFSCGLSLCVYKRLIYTAQHGTVQESLLNAFVRRFRGKTRTFSKRHEETSTDYFASQNVCMPYMAVSSPNAYCSSEHLCERPNITYNALKFNVGLKTYLMGIFRCILKSSKILTIFTPCNSKDSKV